MITYAWWERESSTVVSGPGTVNPSAGSGVSAGTTGGNAGSQVRARVGVTLFIPRSEALLALMPNFGRRFPSGFLDVIVFGCGLSSLEGAGEGVRLRRPRRGSSGDVWVYGWSSTVHCEVSVGVCVPASEGGVSWGLSTGEPPWDGGSLGVDGGDSWGSSIG